MLIAFAQCVGTEPTLEPYVHDVTASLSPSLLTVHIVKWCLDNGISSQITTPVSEQDLASALISALESNTVTPIVAENDVPYDILIAEDNLVNQKLAVKILEKYGHQVEIAENGQLAVDAFKARVQRNRPFDVILVSLGPLLVGNAAPGANEGFYDADGRVHAVHGRYGGDGAHPYLRADARLGAHTHHRAHGAC